MNSFNKSIWKYSLGSLLFVFVACFLRAAPAEAATVAGYPGAQNVGIQGANSNYDGPEARYFIAAPAGETGISEIRLTDACVKKTAGNAGLSATYRGNTKNTNSNCQGNDLVFTSDVAANATLVVRKINGQGNQPFDIRVTGQSPNLQVSALSNPNRESRSFNGTDQNNAFGVWAPNGYRVSMQPDCNDIKAGKTVYFKWKDADDGNGDNQNKNASMEIAYYAGNQYLDSEPAENVGGQGRIGYKAVSLGFSKKVNGKDLIADRYDIVWYGLSGGNAIQMVAPYGNSRGVGCADTNELPEGNISDAGCSYITLRAYDKYGSNVDKWRRADFRVRWINNGGGAEDYIAISGQTENWHNAAGVYNPASNPASNGSPGGRAMSYVRYSVDLKAIFENSANRRFKLEVKDRDDDNPATQWHGVNGAYQTFTRKPNPCSTDPEIPASKMGIAVNCNIVRVTGVEDDNSTSGRIRVSGVVYQRNNDGTKNSGVIIARVDGTTDENGNIDIPYSNIPQGGVNNGVFADVQAFNVKPDGTEDGRTTTKFNAEQPGPCYNSSCSVSIDGTLPGGATSGSGTYRLKANNSYTFRYTVTNTGDGNASRLWAAGGSGLQLTVNGLRVGLDDVPLPDIAQGASYSGTYTYTAPSTIGTTTVTSYVDIADKLALSGCGTLTADVYQPYSLVPQIPSTPEAIPNREDPDRINYSAGVSQETTGTYENATYYSGTIPATLSTALQYYSVSSGYKGPDLHNGSFPGNYASPSPTNYNQLQGLTFTDQVPGDKRFRGTDEWSAGDKFCSVATISTSRGWVGPSTLGAGRYLPIVGSTSSNPSCETVVNNPYTRFYNADVSGRDIKGYLEGDPDAAGMGIGSAVEFAALAMNNIQTFGSAAFRSSLPSANEGLNFKGLGTTVGTLPDYFGTGKRSETVKSPTPPFLNTTGLADDGQTWISAGGTPLNIRGNNSFTGHHAIFIEGDVILNEDIAYSPTAYGVIKDIPSLDIIATGNIYITSNVGRLDGTYVSQSGTIYTCTATNGQRYDADSLNSACNKQLVVNGAFAANDVRLLRTYKTLRDSPYTFDVATGKKRFVRERFGTDNAAESFRLPSDYFIAKRALDPDGSQSNGKYDYYVTLPPAL